MKQTTIYLTEQDQERIKKIKEIQETAKTNDVIQRLIREEYDRIRKYNKYEI